MLFSFWIPWDAFAQKIKTESGIEFFQCEQDKAEQDSFITEAKRNRYTYRRIEFVGNTYTRDRDLRKRLNRNFTEGDIFTRVSFENGISDVSKMKAIYPISLENVQIFLDKKRKDVDLVFCVKQKPNKKD